MEKTTKFSDKKFSAATLRDAVATFESLFGAPSFSSLKLSDGDNSYEFDSVEELFDAYRRDTVSYCTISATFTETAVSGQYPGEVNLRHNMYISFSYGGTSVSVTSRERVKIERIISKFHDSTDFEFTNSFRGSKIRVFIGHGGSQEWRVLNDHLRDKHGYETIAYETGARAGHTIRDILESMTKQSSMAFLVLTGEDQTEHGIRARQNVIHECGLFQGRLGFDKAILLVERGVELASNFDGLQQLRFDKGRISEVFGDAVATIKREFDSLP